MVGNRRSFSKITAILLSAFGLVGFNNNIDSRVYAMNLFKNLFKRKNNAIDIENDIKDIEEKSMIFEEDEVNQGHIFKKNVAENSINDFEKISEEEDNGEFDVEKMLKNPTTESIFMNKKDYKNEKNDKDSTDDKKDDKKDGENEKWSTGKKVGVGSAIALVGAMIIGGIIYLVNRFLRKKNDTPARGLPPQNLNHNSKSNANLNINNNLSNINNKPIVPNR